jgi:hypothetical protein
MSLIDLWEIGDVLLIEVDHFLKYLFKIKFLKFFFIIFHKRNQWAIIYQIGLKKILMKSKNH